MRSNSLDRINCYELPNNSTVNLAPFYEIGRLVRKADIEEKLKKNIGKDVYIDGLLIASLVEDQSQITHYVQHFQIGPSFDEMKGTSKTLDLVDISEDLINAAKQQVKNLIKIFQQNAFLTTFIEISIYDPQDSEGNIFYTFLFANTVEIIKNYTTEMVTNAYALVQRMEILEQEDKIVKHEKNLNSRGPIIPNPNLYRIPLFHLYKSEPSKCRSLNIKESTLFIGSYNVPVHDGFESTQELKEHLKNFLDAALIGCFHDQDKPNLEANSGILLPIARPAARPLGEADSFFQLHRHRGGGLFIFGEEGKDFDVHKFALSLKTELTQSIMEVSYSQAESDKRSEKARSNVISTFTHEIKHLFGALQRNWIPELSRLFDVELENQGLPPENKLGIVKIWDKNLEPTLSVTPFRSFITTLNKLIFLWCGQYNPSDLPFKELPNNLIEAIALSWDFAISVFIMSVLYRYPIEGSNHVYEVEKLYENLRKIYPNLKFNNKQKKEFHICWDKTFAKKSMTLIHILMSIFLNLVKHCDPSREISISISKTKTSRQTLIKIQNYQWEENGISKVVDRLQSRAAENEFDYDLNEIIYTLERAKTHLEDIDVQKMHTQEIINNLLEQIDGKLIAYKKLPPDKFLVEIELGFQK